MTPREMDRIIAEWMGWRWMMSPGSCAYLLAPEECMRLQFAEWTYIEKGLQGGLHPSSNVPGFSTDLNAMARAEQVVRERGLKYEYACELREILDYPLTTQYFWEDFGFAFATATAAQRAEAMCRMIEGLEK